MAPRPRTTPEPNADPTPPPSTLELLRERLRRLLVIQDEAQRQHTQARNNVRVLAREVDECRTAIELAQNPAKGM